MLRGWLPEDFEQHAAMSADPEVMRFLGGVVDSAQSWRSMALHCGHWALRGYGQWVVERKADATLLGRCGLWNPEGWPGLELGWKVARGAWGDGCATEAARAAMQWAFTELDAPRLISLIHPDNIASIRVAERLGLRPLREQTFDGQRVVVFGIERADGLLRDPLEKNRDIADGAVRRD